MRPSLAHSRLRQGLPVRIACMYAPVAMMPRHAAQAGFDAIWLDAEHNTWDRRGLQHFVALHRMANIDCIVRTGSRNAAELYHLLEVGATGLMIPLVNTADDAAALARATKFPPIGQRGLDGAGLDNNFYLEGATTYPAEANSETLLILQIETPESLENLDAIAATPGIDGFFIGPGDLALRLGLPLDWSHPRMVEAQQRVANVASRHDIAWGRPARDTADVSALVRAGAQLIAHGSDFSALYSALPAFAKTIADGIAQASESRS